MALVDHALGDIQASAEYIVHAIKTMHAASGRKVDIVGHSQGGMAPRWALRFWPETREMVDDMIGIAASNHGTPSADGICRATCAPAIWQQTAGSRLLDALNKDTETWAGISYTGIYSHTDEVVLPNFDETGSTSLHTGAGAIANVAIQDVCPLALTEHIGLGTYDPVAYAIALDALDHDGPADSARVGDASCTQLLMPAVNPATFPTDYAASVSAIAVNIASEPRVGAEPALRCYVTDSCPAAAPEPAPAALAAAPGTPPGPAASVQGATLAATGIDLESTSAWAFALLSGALLIAGAARRARV